MIKRTTIFRVLIALFTLVAIFPFNTTMAADKLDDDCAIGLKVEVNPTEVKKWDNPVNVTVILRRDHPAGYYCSTKDVAKVTYQYTVVGTGQTKTLRTVDLTIEPNQTGVGKPTEVRDGQNFDFSKLGAKPDSTGVVVIASAGITRTAGYKTTTIERVSAPVTIRLNKNTTVDQDPTGTVTPGGTTPDPTPGQTPVDTSVGIKCNPEPCDFDRSLGSFFNPLDDGVTVPGLIVRLINIVLMLAGMVAVIYIIFGGFLMVTSAGNQTTLTKGKKTVMYAVAGLIVCILSFSIVAVIQSIIS